MECKVMRLFRYVLPSAYKKTSDYISQIIELAFPDLLPDFWHGRYGYVIWNQVFESNIGEGLWGTLRRIRNQIPTTLLLLMYFNDSWILFDVLDGFCFKMIYAIINDLWRV